MEPSAKPPFPTNRTGLLFSWKNTRQPRTNARLPLFTHSAFLWCFCVVVVWISLPYRAKTVGLMHNSIRKRDKRVTLSILTTSSQLYGAMVTLWLTMTTPHRFFQPDMASNIAGWWAGGMSSKRRTPRCVTSSSSFLERQPQKLLTLCLFVA